MLFIEFVYISANVLTKLSPANASHGACGQAAVRQETELCNGVRRIDKQACATLQHLVLIRTTRKKLWRVLGHVNASRFHLHC